MVIVTGEAVERFARAVKRWRRSGHDPRLTPQAYPSEAQQRHYEMYDRGEWPP